MKFTLAHYEDEGFKGAFFQQIDPANFSRGCSYLDYTPRELDWVLQHFQEWCDSGYKFETREILIDKVHARQPYRCEKHGHRHFVEGCKGCLDEHVREVSTPRPRKIRGTIKT